MTYCHKMSVFFYTFAVELDKKIYEFRKIDKQKYR